MIINSTELQNNFGKYLILAATEDIMITRNGTPIAILSAIKGLERKLSRSFLLLSSG